MKKLFSFAMAVACSMSMWATDYYLQGGCVPSGWNTDLGNLGKCKLEEVSAGVYQWTGVIKAKLGNDDNFKITTNGDWGKLCSSQGNNFVIDNVEQSEIKESGDDKWIVSASGVYTVTLTESGDKKTLTCKRVFTDISNAEDLIAFAERINNGEGDALLAARLTADIDMTGKEYTPMGINDTKGKRFAGLIDGQGHKITNLKVTRNDCGLVQIATGGATIKNLILDSTCEFNASGRVAAFLSCCNFADYGKNITIENCGNMANVTGSSANCAAFIGCNYDNGGLNITIKNCFNTGKIHGSNESAVISGWLNGGNHTIDNFWNIGEVEGVDGNNELWRATCNTQSNIYNKSGKQGTAIEGDLANGELCYKLNGDQSSIKWYQNLPGDATPVPFDTHAKVYANGTLKCDGTSAGGELTYSNSSTTVVPPHTNDGGFCSVCKSWLADGITPVGDWYEISNANQLRWVAEAICEHNSTFRNKQFKLTQDIDYTAYTDQAAMIGKPSNVFAGTFDGQNHTVTVAFNNTADSETALFRRINGGTVKNLKVAGTIETNKSFAGGIVSGVWGNALIQNCEAAVTITDNEGGDGTHGGILARVSDKNNNNGGIQILNCLFSGTMNCPNRTGSGAIVGWSDNGSTEVKIKNCLIIGSVDFKDDSDCDLISRSGATVENCYYTCEHNLKNGKNAIAATAEQTTSGELAFLLGNENWFQNLGVEKDANPVPFNSHAIVYQNGDYKCDHKTAKGSASYSNTEGATYDDHVFENDLCTGCKAVGQIGEKVEGVYQIANIGNLVKFSELVNAGETGAKAVVTADIEQGDAVYTPIGTSEHPYKGTFNYGGDFHTITLAINNPTLSNQGIFGILTGGATIYNLTSAGSVKGATGVAGIAGTTNGGGDVKFFNCGNEATVEATNANGGGILGVDMNSAAKITMTNCYNAGDIKGVHENGGLSGWAGDQPNIINCYNSAGVENGDSFIRCNGDKNFINTYGKNDISDAMLASGELCAKLGDVNFRQEIGVDTHPVLSDTKPNVVSAKVSAAGYATYVAGEKGVKFNAEGLEAYVVSSTDKGYAELADVNEVPAGVAVVLKANEGTYYFNTTTEATAPAANQLVAATEDVTANGTQYVLAMPEGEEVGFYRATEGTIAKGKAYLKSNSNVKAFYFDEEIATGIINANVDADANAAIYNLAGQRVSKMQKGINIVGGKKVLK